MPRAEIRASIRCLVLVVCSLPVLVFAHDSSGASVNLPGDAPVTELNAEGGMIMSDFKHMARQIQAEMIEWRRHIHSHPEIGLEVPETAAFIASTLEKMGLPVKTGIAGHGVTTVVEGKSPGKVFAIRADIDAIAVTEQTGLDFCSRIPGKMHACGHDGHAAMALGAAKLLAARSSDLKGSVKIIFQPAEEGPGGALPMIEAGVLEEPKVDVIIGCHLGTIWGLESGEVGVKPGPLMASTDSFSLTIHGKGGHGAVPHMSVDPVVVGAQCVTALQTIVSREINPLDPAVITVGKFHAGTVANVIPDKADITATVRYFNPSLQSLIRERVEGVLGSIITGMRATYDYTYREGYPPLVNDEQFTHFFRQVAADTLGKDQVKDLREPTMGGEDMSYFLSRVPGTFFALGSPRAVDGAVYPHHHPKFDIDENALWVGAALFAESALRWLQAN